MLRLTGRVTRVDHRAGNSTDKVTGEIRPYAFDTATVLVAEQSIIEVTLFSSQAHLLPGVGDEVDWAVTNVGVRYGKASCQLDKPWADLFPVPGPRAAHKASVSV